MLKSVKVASMEMMAGRSIPGSPWAFANDMRKMINNKQFSDTKFIVGSSRVQIFGNSCILSARSHVFRAMFENEDGLHTACLENPIILPDISPETFLCLLEFLYTNCCTLSEENELIQACTATFFNHATQSNIKPVASGDNPKEYQDPQARIPLQPYYSKTILYQDPMYKDIHHNRNFHHEGPIGEKVIDVLASAAEYSMYELQQICGEFIANTLSISTACTAMQVSVMYSLSNLKETVLSYIEKHAQEVFRTESFHELSEEAFGILLASDNLNIDELDLITLVREWATVNSIGLNKAIHELTRNIIHHIRLLLLSPEELTIVESENEKDVLIPVKMISDAWKYHALKSSSASPSTVVRARSGTKSR